MSKVYYPDLETIERTDEHFYGLYRGAYIEIELPGACGFYIKVWNGGGYSYDGHADSDVETIDDAIEDAIDGALL